MASHVGIREVATIRHPGSRGLLLASARLSALRQRWGSLLIVVAILVPVTLFQPYRNGPPIRSDGAGYHLWTRVLLEGDLSFERYQQTVSVNILRRTGHVEIVALR